MGNTLGDEVRELCRLPVGERYSFYKDLQSPSQPRDIRIDVREEFARFLKEPDNGSSKQNIRSE